METNSKYTLDSIVRGCIALGVCAILYLLVHRLSGVLLPFLISWLVAYMLNPLVEWFLRHGIRKRKTAVAITVLLVLLIMVGFVMMIIPPMVSEMMQLNRYISSYILNMNYIGYLPAALQDDFREFLSSVDLPTVLHNSDVRNVVRSALPRMLDFISGGISALSGLAIFLISCLYVIFILMDFDELSEKWIGLFPGKYRSRAKMVMGDLSSGMNSYFRSQALISAIVGILFAIGFTIIGLPMGIALGMMIAVMNMVPYLHSLSVIPCLLLGILQAAETGRPYWVILISIAVVYLVVQSTLDLYLTPKIMGKAMSMHPAIILLSLSIWGSLLGVFGMIIALPMTTLMMSYYKRFVVEQHSSI